MASGKVKWFNDQKGFGFVQLDEVPEDVFVHHSVIQMDGYRTLTEGQPVELDFERGPKGLKAVSVRSVH
ncbi:MAG: cold-shock protein [Phycisphaerae bacterium]|nr:cold-shock protein [Phycisphaerae bacterium]